MEEPERLRCSSLVHSGGWGVWLCTASKDSAHTVNRMQLGRVFFSFLSSLQSQIKAAPIGDNCCFKTRRGSVHLSCTVWVRTTTEFLQVLVHVRHHVQNSVQCFFSCSCVRLKVKKQFSLKRPHLTDTAFNVVALETHQPQ